MIDTGPYQPHYTFFDNVHSGEPIILVGNGPSLGDVPLEFLTRWPSIGCNSVYLHRDDLVVDYYCIEGAGHLRKPEERAARIPYMRKVARAGGYNFVNRRFAIHFAHIPHCYFIDYLDDRGQIRKDFSFDPLVQHGTGRSVMYFMLQLAHYLGGNPVLMVGIDHKFKDDGAWHFFDEADNQPFDVMTPERFPGWGPAAEHFYGVAARAYADTGRTLLNLTPDTGTDAFETDRLENWL